MGLRKGSLTFSRYRVTGTLPDHFPDFFNERIRRHAFQSLWRTSDEKAVGWTALDDPLDMEFQFASYAQGRYLLFALRIDRKSVPPALLKLKVAEAEQKKRQETGQKRLYREQREAIREAVHLELLGRALPSPSFCEICWSPADNRLSFGSLSDKLFDELQDLFRESFSLSLVPFVPGERLFPELPPTAGASPEAMPANPWPPGIDPLTIGREFLTWLWFKSDERNGIIAVPDLGECSLAFIRRLVLESGNGEYAETVVCQGMHADLKEGREALRQGKKISAARLRLNHDQTEWEFTFKADRFHFQSMKLPTLPEEEGEEIDREGQVLERIYLMEKAAEVMDRLFESFLSLRQTKDWEAEQPRLERWISSSSGL